MSENTKAPKGKYQRTGEFRAPKEGEFYLAESTGDILIAGYGKKEEREIMKKAIEKTGNQPTNGNNTAYRSDNSDLAEAAKSASELLKDYLRGVSIPADKIRAATQTLQIYAKLRAVETAERALLYTIIKDVSTGKDEIRRLVSGNIKELGD